MNTKPAIWFPTVKTNTGTDIFTINLVESLNTRGIKAEITWLPHYSEYLPWFLPIPQKPDWANIVHINTWLHPRFIPHHSSVVATLHHATHDPEINPYKSWLQSQYHQHWIKYIERKTLQRANHITAVSHFAAHITQQQVLNKPIEVISNGIDTQLFSAPDQKYPKNQFRLLYVGAWRTLKGVELLAPIMQELGDGYMLYYTGYSTAKNANEYISKNMINLGRLTQKQVIQSMQTADAFLFPSRSEGFGLVVVEAMACGLPVIVSNTSALTELITNHSTGLLCEKDNVQDFVRTIRYLKANPEKCIKIGKKARDSVIQKFDINNMVSKYVQLYTKILDNKTD